MNENAEKFMREAIKQAKRAAAKGEVPVGAVIVRNGEIISRAYNTRETGKNALCHAEIKAIHRACKKLGGWRLPGCEMYDVITLVRYRVVLELKRSRERNDRTEQKQKNYPHTSSG